MAWNYMPFTSTSAPVKTTLKNSYTNSGAAHHTYTVSYNYGTLGYNRKEQYRLGVGGLGGA